MNNNTAMIFSAAVLLALLVTLVALRKSAAAPSADAEHAESLFACNQVPSSGS